MLGRLETARKTYNAILEAYLDAVRLMRESVEYRRIVGATNRAYREGTLRSDNPQVQRRRISAAHAATSTNPAIVTFASAAERNKAWSALRARFGLASATQTKRSPVYARLQRLARGQRTTYGPHSIGATLVYHVLRDRAYHAVERYLVGAGGRPRLRPRSQPLGGITASSSVGMADSLRVDLDTEILRWAGAGRTAPITARLLFDRADPYVRRALKRRALFVGVRYVMVRGRPRWFALITFEGQPPRKPLCVDGAVVPPRAVVVGVDVGTRHIAAVGEGHALLADFAPEAKAYRARVALKKRRAERAVARSQQAAREAHPECFERTRHGWRFAKGKKLPASNRRRLALAAIAEAQRVEAVQRDRDHGRLANRILAMGTTVRLEALSYRAWQRCFGRSSRDYAPGAFVARLTRRAPLYGGTVELVDPRAKLSQICHCGAVNPRHEELRKPIATRTSWCPECGREPVQRDLYSAFLACYASGTSVDLQAASAAWAGAISALRDASTAYRAPTDRGIRLVNGDAKTSSEGKCREARGARTSASPDVVRAAPQSRRVGRSEAKRQSSGSVPAKPRTITRRRQHGPPRDVQAAPVVVASQGGDHRSKGDGDERPTFDQAKEPNQ